MIPWIIKFAWSGPIDKYVYKGRKFFVIIGGIIGAISFFLLYFINPLNLIGLFTIILFFSQIGQTLLDSAADAWGVDVSKKEDRGKINAAMNIGKVIGMGLGAIVLTYIGQTFGYRYMFILAGIMILINIILPAVIAEAEKKVRRQKVKELLFKEFKKKYVKLLLLFIPLIAIGGGIINFGIDIYSNIVLGLSTIQIGLLTAGSIAFAIPGSILAGIVSDKFGRKRAIYMCEIAFAIIVIIFISTGSLTIKILLFLIGMFFGMGANTALFAFYMDATNPNIGGTQFSIYNGFANLGFEGAGIFVGSLFVLLGYDTAFLFAALAVFPPLILLHFIQIKN